MVVIHDIELVQVYNYLNQTEGVRESITVLLYIIARGQGANRHLLFSLLFVK